MGLARQEIAGPGTIWGDVRTLKRRLYATAALPSEGEGVYLPTLPLDTASPRFCVLLALGRPESPCSAELCAIAAFSFASAIAGQAAGNL
jgi:hypothetical protein